MEDIDCHKASRNIYATTLIVTTGTPMQSSAEGLHVCDGCLHFFHLLTSSVCSANIYHRSRAGYVMEEGSNILVLGGKG